MKKLATELHPGDVIQQKYYRGAVVKRLFKCSEPTCVGVVVEYSVRGRTYTAELYPRRTASYEVD